MMSVCKAVISLSSAICQVKSNFFTNRQSQYVAQQDCPVCSKSHRPYFYPVVFLLTSPYLGSCTECGLSSLCFSSHFFYRFSDLIQYAYELLFFTLLIKSSAVL